MNDAVCVLPDESVNVYETLSVSAGVLPFASYGLNSASPAIVYPIGPRPVAVVLDAFDGQTLNVAEPPAMFEALYGYTASSMCVTGVSATEVVAPGPTGPR